MKSDTMYWLGLKFIFSGQIDKLKSASARFVHQSYFRSNLATSDDDEKENSTMMMLAMTVGWMMMLNLPGEVNCDILSFKRRSVSGVNLNEPINYHYTALSTLVWSTNFKIFEGETGNIICSID